MLRIEDEDEGKRTCIPQPRNALITVFDFRVVSVMKSIRDPTLLAVVKYATVGASAAPLIVAGMCHVVRHRLSRG